MFCRRQSIHVALAAFGLAAFGNTYAQDLADVDIAYEQHQLDNGLTVLLHEDHTAPQVFVAVYYKVGSRDEQPGKTGFAHLFEHLMFNGTENYDGEYFAPLQEVGGSVNGDTWLDRTRYYQTVPNTALERVLWMESDRMGHLLGAVTQEKLDQQRGVVQNEKRQKENRPYAVLAPKLQAGVFPDGHPYNWATIGSMEDLEAASLEDVHAWFKKYYGAANAIITVAGDFDPDETLELIRQNFGDIPAGPPVFRADDWIPVRQHITTETMQDRVADTLIARGWAVPGRDHQEFTMLVLASKLLGGDASSRLYTRLVKDEKIALRVSLSAMPFDLSGMLNLYIAPAKDADLERVRRVTDEVIAEFVTNGPTEEELDLIKTQYAAGQVKGLDSLSGKAIQLTGSLYYMGSADAYKTTNAWVDGASVESIRQAAEKWLKPNYHEVTITPFDDYAVAAEGVDRSQIPVVSSYPSAIAPEVRSLELKNGIKVQFVKRDGVPIVSMRYHFRVGALSAAEENPAAAEIAVSALMKGTSSRSASDIVADMKRTGSNIGARIGKDDLRTTLNGLTSRIDAAMELNADILRNPAFDESEIQLLKEQFISRVEQAKTNPSQLVSMYVDKVMYGAHPYGTAPFTVEDIEALTDMDIREAYKTRFRPGNLTIYVVGGIEEKELLSVLNKHLGGWKQKDSKEYFVDVNSHDVLPPQPRVILFDMPDAVQSNILAATIIDAPYQPGHYAFELANTIFGGTFTSRINMNLREDKGWSYGVNSGPTNMTGPRIWRISARVQSDKTAETIVELLRELNDAEGDRAFTNTELDEVRRERVRKLPGSIASSQGVLAYIAANGRFNRPNDFIESQKAEYEAVDTAAMVDEFGSRVDPQQLVWFISGDLSEIEEGIRGLGLGEVEVWGAEGTRIR